MDIQQYIKARQAKIDGVLKAQLSRAKIPSRRLLDAMIHGVLNGGKRLRPVLAYASAEALGSHSDCANIPACSVELVHGYALIHDDLPAMDDASLRRGLPTCHKVFDEATAVLAGDALQTLAFELLSGSQQLSVGDKTRLKMISILSKAIGWRGMVAGQSLDFTASGSKLDEAGLAQMHELKTGALINASVLLGALSTGTVKADKLHCLQNYAECIGLAFQVKDDILDVESDTKTLGKQQGRDRMLDKPTYISMLGLAGANKKAQELCDKGIEALTILGNKAEPLKGIAEYIIQRKY